MKYRFTITYADKNMQQVSEFMRMLDFGDKDYGIETILEISGNDVELSIMKQTLQAAYESIDCKVYKIEGGKVE